MGLDNKNNYAAMNEKKGVIHSYYTLQDIQDIFKISKQSAYRLVNTPDFPKLKIGKSIRIHPLKLQEYIENHMTGTIIL